MEERPLKLFWEELKRRQGVYQLEDAVRRLATYIRYSSQGYGIGERVDRLYGLHGRTPVHETSLPPDHQFVLRFYREGGNLYLGLASQQHEMLLRPTNKEGQPLAYDQRHLVNLTKLVLEALQAPSLMTRGEPQQVSDWTYGS